MRQAGAAPDVSPSLEVRGDIHRITWNVDFRHVAAMSVQYRRGFLVLLTVYPASLYLLFESPVKMVVAGGISQSVMLPITGAGALYLRHRRLPRELAPGWLVTAGLWIATLVMAAVTLYALVALAGGR